MDRDCLMLIDRFRRCVWLGSRDVVAGVEMAYRISVRSFFFDVELAKGIARENDPVFLVRSWREQVWPARHLTLDRPLMLTFGVSAPAK